MHIFANPVTYILLTPDITNKTKHFSFKSMRTMRVAKLVLAYSVTVRMLAQNNLNTKVHVP